MRRQCRRKPRRRQPHQPGASQKVLAERPMRTGSPKASEPCRSSPRFPFLWRGRAASHRRPRPSCRCSAALSEAPPKFLFALIMRILLPVLLLSSCCSHLHYDHHYCRSRRCTLRSFPKTRQHHLQPHRRMHARHAAPAFLAKRPKIWESANNIRERSEVAHLKDMFR